ncbi:LLM class flavin-dependent oxidoreductase [Paracoccus aminophilus]|uniref:Luciferase-like monooxygenase n=1 Tax=Paracoccus aminophilus JCM 7686 TaxID=1367847 RepID=S5YPW5_PARAH|nr:LLM class flavin-dependent oxidoreductase [Paracoccus aminophilus]AGT07346.1 luciferase family protein [Paracoccus aminophilus JCM 7686]
MKYSLLDLAPVGEGSNISQALQNSVRLAQAAEAAGYHRYWMAEHHNMPGIASAATSVLLNHVANHTKTIRVGAGGVMLPNHAPLAIAEQFGTLYALHGPRIDLGLGRAPGGDGAVMQALRRGMGRNDDFPDDVVQLLNYFGPANPAAAVHAWPGQDSEIEVWILGSSLYGASLAAALGLPYSFASHFAPGDLSEAVRLYRQRFQETPFGTKPHFMLAVNVIIADTDAEARFLRTSQQLQFARLRMGTPGLLPRPVEDIAVEIPPHFMRTVEAALSVSAVGAPETVRARLAELVETYKPDELILVGNIHDPAARVRSFEMAAEILKGNL